jgi:transcriptional regulator with XRE-family HTH domain
VSDLRLGRIARALRHRLGWRQVDIARRASLSQDVVSRIERGQVDGLPVDKLRRVLRAVDADLWLQVRWRGGELDRLLDEGHAALVGDTAELMSAYGWDVRLEVSFSSYGERGSIDLLAWHQDTCTLAVAEIKTEIASVEETLRAHDAKVRLGPQIARARFGWATVATTGLLVLPETSTARRRVARHEAIFSRAYPVRGLVLRSWLRHPSALPGGLMFLSPTHGLRGSRLPRARKRVRRDVSSSAAARRGREDPAAMG